MQSVFHRIQARQDVNFVQPDENDSEITFNSAHLRGRKTSTERSKLPGHLTDIASPIGAYRQVF